MWSKAKEVTLGLLTGFWAVLAPVHTIMYVVGALVFADLIAGITKAMRNKVPITSRRLRDTVGKTLAYQAAILTGFAMDHLAGTDGLLCTRAVAVMVGLTEVKSLDESLQDITGFSIWEALVSKLKPSTKPKE